MDTVSKCNYSEVIETACSILGLPFSTIKEKYAEMPICISQYIDNNEKDNIIEVRFDDAEITLSCSFNKENFCDASFLFFDDTNKIEHVVSYLNNRFRYDYIKSRWILPKCYLLIKPSKDDIHIALYKESTIR